MSAIQNDTSILSAAWQTGVAPGEPLKAAERLPAEAPRPAEEPVAVRPRLYDVLQSIKQLASATEYDAHAVGATPGAGHVRDANIADDLLAMAKSQILNQSGASALAQPNQPAHTVLSLLK